MEITEDIPEPSFNKTAADLSSDNQNIWKGDECKSGNTIWKLHLLCFTLSQQWEVFMHALRLWVCRTVLVIFLSTEKKTDCYTFFINHSTIAFQIGEYISQQPFLLYAY